MSNEPKTMRNVAHKHIGVLLMQDSELMNILKDYHVVRLDDEDDFNEKLSWCLEHCQNKFRDIREAKSRAWYFQNEQDATMFAMKWS
jgi:hypothetical protein